MLSEDRGVELETEVSTSDAKLNEQTGSAKTEMPTKKLLTEEEFDEFFDKANITPRMQKYLYKSSRKAFVGYLIRFIIVLTILGGLAFAAFTAETYEMQVPFAVLTLGTIFVVNRFDLCMGYSYNTVKWYKAQDIQKCYMAVVTRKWRTRKAMIFELNDENYIRVVDSSVYNSISRNEVILILVKNDKYHVVGTCGFLGMPEPAQGLRDLFN